jgi:hypothetical protein
MTGPPSETQKPVAMYVLQAAQKDPGSESLFANDLNVLNVWNDLNKSLQRGD